MKKNILFIVLFLISIIKIQAQNNYKEQVYLHLSETDLIVGENIHFSAFCYSKSNGNLSKLSSLLYVEVLNAKGSAVLQTKIKLKNGRGVGKFFVISDLPTGAYHVVAYTQWMRNFDDYFHTPIAIINPYKKPSKPVSSGKLNVDFYPESGQILEGKNNKILLAIQDYKGQQIKGKIINDKNEVALTNLQFDKYGFCVLKLDAKTDEKYQFVLDYEQKFQFFDLPNSKKTGSQITLIQDENNLKIQANSSSENSTGKLEFWTKNGILKTQEIKLNAEHNFSRKDFPNELINIRLKSQNKVLNERLFWNGKTEKVPEILAKKKTSEPTKIELDVPENAKLSVSVKRHYGNFSYPSLQNYAWFSNLKTDLDLSKINTFNADLLDKILMASSFKKPENETQNLVYFPEYKQGIIQGKILDWNQENESSIALSFKGIQNNLMTNKIQNNGDFLLRYDPDYSNENPIISVVGKDSLEDKISVQNEFYDSFTSLPKLTLNLDSVYVKQIVKRSIENQIQNAYYRETKAKDSIKIYPKIEGYVTYILDNFTRFPTLRDTFIEYILEASVSKNEKNFEIKIRPRNIDYTDKTKLPTLFLIDGILTDSEHILKTSSASVKQIDVMSHRYFMDGIAYDGIVSLTTFQNNTGSEVALGKQFKFTPVQESTSEIIGKQINNPRIPAHQDLLYWNPDLKTENIGKVQISFPTSKVKGRYELRVEGITETGKIVSQKYWLTVE